MSVLVKVISRTSRLLATRAAAVSIAARRCQTPLKPLNAAVVISGVTMAGLAGSASCETPDPRNAFLEGSLKRLDGDSSETTTVADLLSSGPVYFLLIRRPG
eukprot:m.109246 g.109246  ORF g.109246 m.109246 type:complete len:102 (+) comp13997_c0_seq3:38-343(+)